MLDRMFHNAARQWQQQKHCCIQCPAAAASAKKAVLHLLLGGTSSDGGKRSKLRQRTWCSAAAATCRIRHVAAHSAGPPVAWDVANKFHGGGSKTSIAFRHSAATRRKVKSEPSCRVRRSAVTGALIAFMEAAVMTPEVIIFLVPRGSISRREYQIKREQYKQSNDGTSQRSADKRRLHLPKWSYVNNQTSDFNNKYIKMCGAAHIFCRK